ncbi:hypothetical protein [Dictyobacter vulcani]|nr:hypothetical protein [Dictyobacter vulcani]
MSIMQITQTVQIMPAIMPKRSKKKRSTCVARHGERASTASTDYQSPDR